MFSWTNPYTPPEMAGVTAGTVSVPPFRPLDWRLTSRTANGNKYVCYNPAGGIAELEVNQTNVSNIYGNSNVAANEQLPLLSGRSAYVRLRMFGFAEEIDCDSMSGLAPLSVSVNVTVPTGCQITTKNIQDVLSVALSAFSEPDISGQVEPMSDTMEMAMGAINK